MFDEIFENVRKVNESTRARIGVEKPDGSIESIYLHNDGYPDGAGKILQKHYTNPDKVQELMDLGDISSLGPEIGQKHDFNEQPRDQVNAYGRDRGESDVSSRISDSEEDFEDLSKESAAEYFYLFRDGQWVTQSTYGEDD